jgi:hypothetical protein
MSLDHFVKLVNRWARITAFSIHKPLLLWRQVAESCVKLS